MYLLDPQKPFSQSLLWQLQRNYFSSVGIDAWRSGEVPHYLTSNPVVGKTYAELVLAFLRDLALKGQTEAIVYLVELGAGHGRLCYHFFKHFEKYYEQSAIPLPPFCYVLTDFTEANLTFWQQHPRLQPFLSQGMLDVALFDAENSVELVLQQTKKTIQVQSLEQPLIVVGNYFFDTIPQELFRIKDQQIEQCLLTLFTPSDPAKLDATTLIDQVVLTYNYRSQPSSIYGGEPVFNQLLEVYRSQLSDTHLLFPYTGIRCIARLRQLSKMGLLLLSADKGDHRIEQLDHHSAPQIVSHGSFSLSVNYHAFQQYCAMQSGLALFPRYEHFSLDLGCMLFVPQAKTYRETIAAYERFVNDYGPDDYFSLKKLIEKRFANLTFRDIIATLRLSGYDARIFHQMLPRLQKIVITISEEDRWSLFQSIHRIWDTYYPLGEEEDLAFDLGCLLYELGFDQEAIVYFRLSIQIYGTAEETP